MRLRCIACEALARVVYSCAARSPHVVDIDMLKLGLHNEPSDLRSRLQERIDSASPDECDSVVMAYGLCGKATSGLRAGHVPLIIPRAHDCITLFLGGRERYREQFEECPGTYWYVADYIERGGKNTSLSIGNASDESLREMREEFVQTYGPENAEYLMEVLGGWNKHYRRAAFIDMDTGDSGKAEQTAREESARRGWEFERLTGDVVLIRKLLSGDWDGDFLQVAPGKSIAESFDESVMRSE
jgi:hypothetical protein